MDRKSSRRSQRADSAAAETPHHDVVAIERNAIEQWLLDIKHWITAHRDLFRKIILFSFSGIILVAVLIFVFVLIGERHNRQFYNMLEELDKTRPGNIKDPLSQADREKKIREVLENSDKLCDSLVPTKGKYNACLISALAAREIGQGGKSSERLQKYADHAGKSALGSFFKFYAAYSASDAGEFDRAAIYLAELENAYKDIKREDVAIFQRGRNLYMQGKLAEAEALFSRIETEFPASSYRMEAQKYLYLVEVAKRKKAAQPSSQVGKDGK